MISTEVYFLYLPLLGQRLFSNNIAFSLNLSIVAIIWILNVDQNCIFFFFNFSITRVTAIVKKILPFFCTWSFAFLSSRIYEMAKCIVCTSKWISSNNFHSAMFLYHYWLSLITQTFHISHLINLSVRKSRNWILCKSLR